MITFLTGLVELCQESSYEHLNYIFLPTGRNKPHSLWISSVNESNKYALVDCIAGYG